MSALIGQINRILNGAFDAMLWPFRSLDPLWGLTAVSLLTGVLMLWIFGRVSDQDSIRSVRDRIRGNLIGIRLFGDDLGMLFRLQARIFRQTMTYLRFAMLPMVVLLVPVLLVLVQLNLRFAVRPLVPGEAAVVKLTLRGASPFDQGVSLEAPTGVSVETPGVRMPDRGEVAWRVRAVEPGEYQLTARAGGDEVGKRIVVGDGWRAISPLRSSSWVDLLLYPGEPPIPSGNGIRSVEVGYSALPLSLFGFGVDWLLFFFVASIAFGFAFRRPLGVEI